MAITTTPGLMLRDTNGVLREARVTGLQPSLNYTCPNPYFYGDSSHAIATATSTTCAGCYAQLYELDNQPLSRGGTLQWEKIPYIITEDEEPW